VGIDERRSAHGAGVRDAFGVKAGGDAGRQAARHDQHRGAREVIANHLQQGVTFVRVNRGAGVDNLDNLATLPIDQHKG
jgi:hypothetical protein